VLAVLAVLGVILFLRFSSGLMIPIVIAVLMACAAAPLVGWLDRLRMPRWLSAGVVTLLIAGLFGWGAFALGDELVAIGERFPAALAQLRDTLVARGGIFAALDGAMDGQATRDLLLRGSASFAAILGDLAVVFFLLYFLLFAGDQYAHLIESVGSRSSRQVTAEILGDIYTQIQRFLVVQVLTSAIVGAATFVLLVAIGVEHAPFWAVMAGLGNTIPYFGPVIISGGLAVVAMMQFGGVSEALWVSAGALAITSIEGWVLVPLLMGRAERMNVIAVFLGLLLWSWIWGVWGTILAVPMLAVLKAIGDHIHPLQPLGKLLGPLPDPK